jgi:FkbM family methyltransferase
MDVASRYCRNWSWYPESVLPPKGGTMVEVGAYLGHKSIRFVDDCISEGGKFLAVEIMPENFEIFKKNIQVNNLTGTMSVVHSGAWFEEGELDVHVGGTVRNSLVAFSEESKEFEKQAVPVNTLDNILRNWEPNSCIDFIDIRVNGAEYEALQGLDEQLGRIRYMFLPTKYSADGRDIHSLCRKLLLERGCKILESISTKSSLYAKGLA